MINQTLMYLLLVIYENVNISTYYIGIIYKDETSLIFCTTKEVCISKLYENTIGNKMRGKYWEYLHCILTPTRPQRGIQSAKEYLDLGMPTIENKRLKEWHLYIYY